MFFAEFFVDFYFNTEPIYVIEVSCWIITGERQTAIIRSKYVQVLLNQDMSFFDTYGNNGDIVSQVFTDVSLIQSTLSEKVRLKFIIFLPLRISSTVRLHLHQVQSIDLGISIPSESFFIQMPSLIFNDLVLV